MGKIFFNGSFYKFTNDQKKILDENMNKHKKKDDCKKMRHCIETQRE